MSLIKIRKMKRSLGIWKGPGKEHIKTRESRYDTKRFEVSKDTIIDVYWKDLPNGYGPALSCFILGYELLKFDCFGEIDGHMHIDFSEFKETKENRLFFHEKCRFEQIDRCISEIERNMPYYTQRHQNQDVRLYQWDTETFGKHIPDIKATMLEYLDRAQTHHEGHKG